MHLGPLKVPASPAPIRHPGLRPCSPRIALPLAGTRGHWSVAACGFLVPCAGSRRGMYTLVVRLNKLFEVVKGNHPCINTNSVGQNTWSGILFLLGVIMGIDLRI